VFLQKTEKKQLPKKQIQQCVVQCQKLLQTKSISKTHYEINFFETAYTQKTHGSSKSSRGTQAPKTYENVNPSEESPMAKIRKTEEKNPKNKKEKTQELEFEISVLS
jgi:hypothetical protein